MEQREYLCYRNTSKNEVFEPLSYQIRIIIKEDKHVFSFIAPLDQQKFEYEKYLDEN